MTMESHLIKHSLLLGAGTTNSYSPEGWNPQLRLTIMGPVPSDTELRWTMYKPDGSSWFDHSVTLPELEDEEMHSASLQHWEDGTDIAEAGAFRFTLSLV